MKNRFECQIIKHLFIHVWSETRNFAYNYTDILLFCLRKLQYSETKIINHENRYLNFKQGCESSDFNLISGFFSLHKPHFQTFNALNSTSFQAFQIISNFFSQTLSHPCSNYENILFIHIWNETKNCAAKIFKRIRNLSWLQKDYWVYVYRESL